MQPGTMLNPVPVVMVSCRRGEENNIITIAWTGIINSDPPLTYISVRKSRHSHELISQSGEFVINLTTEKLARATDFCGVRSGRDTAKAEELHLEMEEAALVNCAMIKASPVNLECKVIEVKTFPTHDMFIAEILQVHASEELFNEKGRLCLEQSGLICYSHGEYFGLKRQPLGKFGYSIMKPKTRKRINRQKAAARSQKRRGNRTSSYRKSE